jgi:hypothetical protein
MSENREALQESERELREAVEKALAVLVDRDLEDFLARVRAGTILQDALGRTA